MLLQESPVANGLRTDHPVPDLPFVDDSHIPIEDPHALEAVGRHEGGRMWGRCDELRDGRGWVAFTTDPLRPDLAWLVRWHPEHGRSVVLYRNSDVAGVHSVLAWTLPALLFRAGGYWWDGSNWFRPAQVFDYASERYVQRSVPAARTISAMDLLPVGSPRTGGQVLEIEDFDPDAPANEPWLADLAVWATRRVERGSGGDLGECVVKLTAPELSGEELIGVADLAEIGGVAASTLRAYIAREEGDVPVPQATVSGRNMWSRPVADEWAEYRRRSAEGIEASVSTRMAGAAEQPPGIVELWERFTQEFFSKLWTYRNYRKRWALRWRNQAAVRHIAENLSWSVAADFTSYNGVVPIGNIAITIREAILHDLWRGLRLHQRLDHAEMPLELGISLPLAETLDWLIRHQPLAAGYTIAEIVGEAERDYDLPREVTERSIRTALHLDGKLDPEQRDEFLDRVMTPVSPD